MINSRQLINQLRVAYFQPTPLVLPNPYALEYFVQSNVCRPKHLETYPNYRVNVHLVPFAPCARVGGVYYRDGDTYYCQNFGSGDLEFNVCNGYSKSYGSSLGHILLQSTPPSTNGKYFLRNGCGGVIPVTWLYANNFTRKFVNSLFI